MSKKALVVHGGWDGHDPVKFAGFYRDFLKSQGYEVEVSDTLKSFEDEKKLMGLDLIVPHWTGGVLTREQYAPVIKAVMNGVGIAGIHGGMCDAFHDCIEWQFMTGGQWVAHAGGQHLKYTVNIKQGSHKLVEGLTDFQMESEQYYMHLDPAIKVLASTKLPVGKGPFIPSCKADLDPGSGYGVWNFDPEGAEEGPHVLNGDFEMPVAYIKYYGKGRVFYTSLGHIFDDMKEPQLVKLIQRGLLWASR